VCVLLTVIHASLGLQCRSASAAINRPSSMQLKLGRQLLAVRVRTCKEGRQHTSLQQNAFIIHGCHK